jgi:hypothetical protein
MLQRRTHRKYAEHPVAPAAVEGCCPGVNPTAQCGPCRCLRRTACAPHGPRGTTHEHRRLLLRQALRQASAPPLPQLRAPACCCCASRPPWLPMRVPRLPRPTPWLLVCRQHQRPLRHQLLLPHPCGHAPSTAWRAQPRQLQRRRHCALLLLVTWRQLAPFAVLQLLPSDARVPGAAAPCLLLQSTSPAAAVPCPLLHPCRACTRHTDAVSAGVPVV